MMEYQKIVNIVDDTTNQPSKCRTGNWVEINYASRGDIIMMMKIVMIIIILMRIIITLNSKRQG